MAVLMGCVEEKRIGWVGEEGEHRRWMDTTLLVQARVLAQKRICDDESWVGEESVFLNAKKKH